MHRKPSNRMHRCSTPIPSLRLSEDFDAPIGRLTLVAEGEYLTGVYFEHYLSMAAGAAVGAGAGFEVLEQTKAWLEQYFRGECPGFMPPLRWEGTPFRCAVWQLLQQIPYGETVTYKELAREMAHQRGMKQMSAQAVGGAVGHNPIALLVPCHRVIGTDGSLTGYSGGLERKRFLLELERRGKGTDHHGSIPFQE